MYLKHLKHQKYLLLPLKVILILCAIEFKRRVIKLNFFYKLIIKGSLDKWTICKNYNYEGVIYK